MILYTKKDCPLCHVVKLKLDIMKIKYKECQDIEIMNELGITQLPMASIDEDAVLLNFSEIMDYINNGGGGQ